MKWYEVIITFKNRKLHMDKIKGRTPETALNNAIRNWPKAVEIMVFKS